MPLKGELQRLIRPVEVVDPDIAPPSRPDRKCETSTVRREPRIARIFQGLLDNPRDMHAAAVNPDRAASDSRIASRDVGCRSISCAHRVQHVLVDLGEHTVLHRNGRAGRPKGCDVERHCHQSVALAVRDMARWQVSATESSLDYRRPVPALKAAHHDSCLAVI